MDYDFDEMRAKVRALLDAKIKYESHLENYLFEELQKMQAMGLKLSPVGSTGLPDVFVFYKGGFWAVELKKEKGTLKDHQKAFHLRLKRYGHTVRVLRGKEEVNKFIAELKKYEPC